MKKEHIIVTRPHISELIIPCMEQIIIDTVLFQSHIVIRVRSIVRRDGRYKRNRERQRPGDGERERPGDGEREREDNKHYVGAIAP